MNEESQASQANNVSIPPQNEQGFRLYNRPYTERLVETLAHEAGFPVAFQGDQFEKLLELLFSRRLVICKVYDDESWNQVQSWWSEGKHFHMFPRWKKPEPVPAPVPAPVSGVPASAAVPAPVPVPVPVPVPELKPVEGATVP
jgi:hypothetical protein